jgi:ParB family chromosome partitioning protein
MTRRLVRSSMRISSFQIVYRMEKKLVNVNLSELKPYSRNPRRNNKSAKIVAKSIEAYGYINPIVVTDTMLILAGHTRLKALKILKYTEADVLVVSGLTEDQIKGFIIADNRVGEYSQWNYAEIDRLMSEDPDELMGELGLSSFSSNKKDLEGLLNIDEDE